MATFKTVGGKNYTLASSISSTVTSITLSSFTLPITNQAITMATANTSIMYGTLQPGTTNSELISFTGVTQNANGTATLTGVTRGLDREDPYGEVSAFKLPHPGQSIFILSDAPQVFNSYPAKVNDETITGKYTFPNDANTPLIGASYAAPTIDNQVATKKYIDDIAIAGSPKATDSVYGITKLSVAAVSPTDPIAVGNNDTRMPTQGENDALVGNNTDVAVGTGNKFVTQTGLQHNAEKYAADTSGSSTAYVATYSPAPTSLTAGMVFYVKFVNANTTTTPTFNPNGLGAKTIVKNTNTALLVGDIAANMFCTLIYDGTNMVLQNPTTPIAFTATTGSGSMSLTTSTVTSTITHSLGVIPKSVQFFFTGVTSGGYGQALINASGTVLAQDCSGTAKTSDGYAGHPDPFRSDSVMRLHTYSGGFSSSVTIGTITSTQFTLTATAMGGGAESLGFYWVANN